MDSIPLHIFTLVDTALPWSTFVQGRKRNVIARASSRAGPPPSTAIPPSTDHTPVKNLTSSAKQQNDSFDTACDLKAGTVLQDADYGEHAAAFLSGNFQPVIEEVTASVLLSGEDARGFEASNQTFYILGEIPADFPAGKFAYVGPNPKFSLDHYKIWGRGPNQSNSGGADGWHHWFEGDGMIYALDFGGANTHLWQKGSRKEAVYNSQGGGDKQKSFHAKERGASRNVCYRNRYVRTNSWKKEMRHGGRLFRPLMNASGSAFLPNAVANFLLGGSFLKDSANTALCHFTGRLFALQDTMPPWELNNDTLETVGICDFDGTLPFYVPFTAHPKVAPGTGDLLFFGFNPVYPPHCSIGSVSPEGSVGPIKALWHNALRGATFIHDFCVTENYTVIFEGSMNIRPMRMLKGVHPLQYDRSQLARFGVIRRRSDGTMSDVTWCVCAEPEMVYHFVNAWEDSLTGDIVIVGVREDGFFHGALAATGTRNWITNTLQEGKSVPRLHEWRIDPSSGRILSERWLFDDVIEIPRINDKFTGLQNRYAYAGRIHTASLSRDAQLKFDAVVKYDMKTGTKQIYEHGSGCYGMEAQFVPRSHSNHKNQGSQDHGTEDDGWLVLFVHDESDRYTSAAEGRSECIILDAKKIQEGPIARLKLPSRVPYGAHAMWCPLADIATSIMHPDGNLDCIDNNLVSKEHDYMLCRPPEPRPFAISKGQHKPLLGAAMTGVLRAATGLFVNGWRPWVAFDDFQQYAFIRCFGLRLIELNSLGMVRREQIETEMQCGRIFGDVFGLSAECSIESALPLLTLFELEGCGDCRRVREALCMLDISCTHKPCPHGAVHNRLAAAVAQNQTFGLSRQESIHAEDAKLPYLEDERTGVRIAGADQIIEYLYSEYLDGAAPPPTISSGPFASVFAQIAVEARGPERSSHETAPSRRGPSGTFYSRPSRTPEKPLQLWAYEASPFCTLVRETLSELELSYVLQPCARGSPRRTQLMHRTGGTFQVPYLEDPNTGVAMFESAEIIKYLRSRYLQF